MARVLADTVDDYDAPDLSPEQETAQAMYDAGAVQEPYSQPGKDYRDEFRITYESMMKSVKEAFLKMRNADDPDLVTGRMKSSIRPPYHDVLDYLKFAASNNVMLINMYKHLDSRPEHEKDTDGHFLAYRGLDNMVRDAMIDFQDEYMPDDIVKPYEFKEWAKSYLY